jgi:hypothetical protein
MHGLRDHYERIACLNVRDRGGETTHNSEKKSESAHFAQLVDGLWGRSPSESDQNVSHLTPTLPPFSESLRDRWCNGLSLTVYTTRTLYSRTDRLVK